MGNTSDAASASSVDGVSAAPFVVIGVGNVLMGDDGIGPRVADALRRADKRQAGERQAGERQADKRQADKRQADKRQADKRQADKRQADKRQADKRQADKRQASATRSVEIIDGGLAGLSLLEWLEGRRRAIIVDAARMGTRPGTIVRFSPDQVNAAEHSLAAHQASVLAIIEFGRGIMTVPPVVIYGVEPDRVEPGMRLSRRGRRAVGDAARRILAELRDWQGDKHGQGEDPSGG